MVSYLTKKSQDRNHVLLVVIVRKLCVG